jgi:hypothetical protein
MRRRFLPGILLLAAALLISVPVTAQAQDAWVGTWKLNIAKSKFEPANLAPKSQTVKAEAIAGGGMKSIVDGVDWQGKTLHQDIITKFDGKPSEVPGAPDANTTRVYKRIDSRTYEFVTSVNGKVTTTSRSVVSADGKTRTITATGTNAQGQTVHNVSVYDRQ